MASIYKLEGDPSDRFNPSTSFCANGLKKKRFDGLLVREDGWKDGRISHMDGDHGDEKV